MTIDQQAEAVGGTVPRAASDREAGPTIYDGRMGRMACYFGWMTPAQVETCLDIQRRGVQEGRPPLRFGEAAIQAGFLTPDQVAALLRVQVIHRPTDHDRTFGAVAVRMGLLSQEQLDACLAEQKELLARDREAPLLGVMLAAKGVLTRQQVRQVLDRQAELGGRAKAAGQPAQAAAVAPAEGRGVACECRACGHKGLCDSWGPDTPCTACGARAFYPVAVVGGAVAYALASRDRGPSVEDLRLGRMAYFAGWLTPAQAKTCLKRQADAAQQGLPVPKFGEAAIALGFLRPAQVDALLRIQAIHRPAEHDTTFGAVAVRHGFITQAQLDQALAEQARLLEERHEAPLLGMILVEKDLLSEQQVKAILAVQARYGRGPLAELASAAEAGAGAAPALALLRSGEVRMSLGALALTGLAVALLATGWFGLLADRELRGVAGCVKCREVMDLTALPPECPRCHKVQGLCPVVRCGRCGVVFLFGSRGSGPRCPKCGATGVEEVRDLQVARATLLPPPTPPPRPLPTRPRPATPR